MDNAGHFMKNFFNILKNEDIFHSSKPVAVVAFAIIAIIITSLFSIRYYLYQNLVDNGIAKKTIVAKNTFEVIDKQRTELIKREVASKIRPVVAPVEGDKVAYVLEKFQMEKVPAKEIPAIGPRMKHIPLVAEPRRIAVRYDQITAFQA